MNRLFLFLLAVLPFVSCDNKAQPDPEVTLYEFPSYKDGEKKGNISYQLLVYSFADSNADGIGDFQGIISKLDYLDAMGVSALWLSPVHPSDSYHGYDVQDYAHVNPDFGSESDFKALVEAAHKKGIKIYLDYVLNHTGKGNQWFLDAQKSTDASTFGWYHISANPAADIAGGKFPMLGAYNAKEWHNVTIGEIGYKGRLHFEVDWGGDIKTLTVSPSSDPAQASNPDTSVQMYLWYGSIATPVRLYRKTESVYEITLDVDTNWGVLVRTSETEWGQHKWGAPAGANVLTLGKPLALSNSDSQDIIFGRATTMKFQGAFGSWMPDLNYGAVATCSQSEPFKALAATADKWINLGVDGFRLDAVKHIYSSETGPENPEFLKQWYDRCNETFRNRNGRDIYMVGEAWLNDAEQLAPYYKGLTACFEFDFWERLKWVLQNRTGRYLAKDLIGYRIKYRAERPDAIAATILTNHDQTRAATTLNRNLDKLKQAAAILMTAEGEPYIYQGEELGYWGKDYDDGGADELVRTPMIWDKASRAAAKYLNGKIDLNLMTDEISVARQKEDSASLLRTYLAWTRARNTCPALASGKMSAHGIYNDGNAAYNSVAAWYMTAPTGEKSLVLHNVGSQSVTLNLTADKLDNPVVSLGEVSVSEGAVTLGGNSSVVYNQ